MAKPWPSPVENSASRAHTASSTCSGCVRAPCDTAGRPAPSSLQLSTRSPTSKHDQVWLSKGGLSSCWRSRRQQRVDFGRAGAVHRRFEQRAAGRSVHARERASSWRGCCGALMLSSFRPKPSQQRHVSSGAAPSRRTSRPSCPGACAASTMNLQQAQKRRMPGVVQRGHLAVAAVDSEEVLAQVVGTDAEEVHHRAELVDRAAPRTALRP